MHCKIVTKHSADATAAAQGYYNNSMPTPQQQLTNATATARQRCSDSASTPKPQHVDTTERRAEAPATGRRCYNDRTPTLQ